MHIKFRAMHIKLYAENYISNHMREIITLERHINLHAESYKRNCRICFEYKSKWTEIHIKLYAVLL